MKKKSVFIILILIAIITASCGSSKTKKTDVVGKWGSDLDSTFTANHVCFTFYEDKTGYIEGGTELYHFTWNATDDVITVFIPIEDDPDVKEFTLKGKIESSGHLVIGNDLAQLSYELQRE